MEDLEESVEVPVAIVGATVPDVAVGVGGASSGAVGGAAVPTAGAWWRVLHCGVHRGPAIRVMELVLFTPADLHCCPSG